MGPCSGQADFDIAATAALYSTLAGVLAGFAFTALVMLLGIRIASPTSHDDRLGSVVEVLLAAFLALVLSSLTYAALGGEPDAAGRAASEEVVAGVGLAVAGLLVLYSIVLTIDAVVPIAGGGDDRMSVAGVFVRRVVVHGFAPLVTLYLGLGVEDYLTVRDGVDRSPAVLDTVSVALAAVVLVVSFPAFARARRRTLPRSGRWAAVGGLAIAFLSAFGFALVTALLPRCELANTWVIYAAVMVNFLAVLAGIPLIASQHIERGR